MTRDVWTGMSRSVIRTERPPKIVYTRELFVPLVFHNVTSSFSWYCAPRRHHPCSKHGTAPQTAYLYYTFEDNAKDSSTNGYEGSLQGSASVSTNYFRYGEQALYLSSSTSDYVYYSGTFGATTGTVAMFVRQSTGGYAAELFKIGTSGSTNFVEVAFERLVVGDLTYTPRTAPRNSR